MKKILLFLIAFLSTSLQANGKELCTYNMQINNGKIYPLSNYSDFIKIEFRSQFNQKKSSFDLKLTRSCDSLPQSSIIQIDTQTFIVEKINGHKINTNLKRYSNSQLRLNANEFKAYFDMISEEDFSNENKKEAKQNGLKFFTFIFSDAARFEDINIAVQQIFTHTCTIQRADYIDLTQHWKRLSEYGNYYELHDSDAYKGGPDCNLGKRYCLVAPISHKVIESYIQHEGKGVSSLLPSNSCTTK